MKKIFWYLCLMLLCVGLIGCASFTTSESGRELHPGHPGHEVH